jgi:hypothetical protein
VVLLVFAVPGILAVMHYLLSPHAAPMLSAVAAIRNEERGR